MPGSDDRTDGDVAFGPVDALVALAIRDGLGERLTWGEVLPVVLAVARDPIGPRNCRRLFVRVNDAQDLATIEDWFHRAAAERDASVRKTGRAVTMIARPVQRSALAGAAGIGLAMAVGTLASGPGALLLLVSLGVGGGATGVGYRLQTAADTETDLADMFRRLEAIAQDERMSRKRRT